MSAIHVVDETFVVAAPAEVRAVVCDPAWWAAWLPDVALDVVEDRGRLGVRWRVAGVFEGTAEVWLEEFGDGTIVHTYLRSGRWAAPSRVARRGRRRHALALKQAMFAVKDALESGRRPGAACPPSDRR